MVEGLTELPAVEVSEDLQKKSLKREIIPQEWKRNIDSLLLEDLLEANRYFAKVNPLIAQLVQIEASKNPEEFYLNLMDRWKWHNRFYEDLLEPALPLLVEPTHFELSPSQVRNLLRVYEACSLVDQATLIVSAAIKQHLDSAIEREESSLNPDQVSMLMTPTRESFWLEYHKDHAEYILALKRSDRRTSEIKARLLTKYHANDEEILEGRLQRLGQYQDMGIDELERYIKGLTRNPRYKTRHRLFTMSNPRYQAITNVLEFDNRDEYMFLMSLVGISGYVLRKRILSYLNESKLLPNNGGIYEHDDREVTQAVDKLLSYRKELFFKKVSPYQQTGLTCGAACQMMVANYFGLSNLDRETENKINKRTKSKHIDGNHFSAIANELCEMGLEVALIHSEAGMFRNDGFFEAELFSSLVDEYNYHLSLAKNKGCQVMVGVNIDSDLIREYLERNYLVVLAGHNNEILHAILVVGYNQEGFIVNDPLTGLREVRSFELVNRFINTPIGKWCLAVRKNHRQIDSLLSALPEFVEQARSYLKVKKGGGDNERM